MSGTVNSADPGVLSPGTLEALDPLGQQYAENQEVNGNNMTATTDAERTSTREILEDYTCPVCMDPLIEVWLPYLY